MSPSPLPAAPKQLVCTPEELERVCEHLRGAGTFAFDTEFIGETTYQPILCLIQVATTERVELIDPIGLGRGNMAAFWTLIADASLEKACHAGDQDLEITWQHSGHAARNVFDTQIGAGMIGLSYPTALWRAVEHFAGVTLAKSHTFSAWDRRPLTKAQFAYAIDDVRYLPDVHAAMKARLAELGHGAWMRAACDDLCTEAARPVDPRSLYVRIRGAAGLNPQQLAVLREVTALREQMAYEHEVPARTFLSDEMLLDIASRMPRSVAELGRIPDLPRQELDSYGPAIVQAVAAGAAVEEADRPSMFIPGEDPAEVKRLGETLWVATQAICLGQSVTPGLVTCQSEIMAIARAVHKKKPFDRHAILHGWRRECLGEKLAAFIKGELRIDIAYERESMHAGFHSAVRPEKQVG